MPPARPRRAAIVLFRGARPTRLRLEPRSGIISPRHTSHDRHVETPLAAAAPAENRTSVNHERLFLDNLEIIESVITQICRRHHLRDDEAEEFRSRAHLKLIENDYRVLREYKGKASMRTYLSIVLENLFLDYRNSIWGKWRPSVEARRTGPVAMLLERLILRDGYSFEEALEILSINHKVTTPRSELEKLFARLPIRQMRKPQSDDALIGIPDAGPPPDAEAQREERRRHIAFVWSVLKALLLELDESDRLLIQYRFIDGLKVVRIAVLMNVDAKHLHRRIEKILDRLRRELEKQGIDHKDLFNDDEPWE
jgi:RNA polymerase sigma factor (sigma-70 family)